MPIATLNPATGETLRTFDPFTRDEVDTRLGVAQRAFHTWRLSSLQERAASMQRAAAILEAEKDSLGQVMTLEMGKPITAAVAEAEKCALACRYYAETAAVFLADEHATTHDGHAHVTFQPLGVILAVMPWNFPFWQVFRFVAPALMAGNCGILKHSSNVPQCALAIEDILRRAGFPDGVFQTFLVESREVASLIEDPRIAAVTLTGSESAGRAVAGTAGSVLKKTVLELGGSDPFIVMPSADLGLAVETAVRARMINNGQSCIAAKRFVIHQDIHGEFMQRFVDGVRSIRIGDPTDPATELGPLATEQIRADLHTQVEKTISMGARAMCGAKSIDRAGFYYEPTVLADIPPGSPAEQDELFGPVAAVWSARSPAHAVEIANNSRFGLGASVWTEDQAERELFIRDIESGMVFVNGMVASEPGLPFGGVKASGYGRELGGFGIREFVNIKSVKQATGRGNASDSE